MRWNEEQLLKNTTSYIKKYKSDVVVKNYLDYTDVVDIDWMSSYRFPEGIFDHKDYPNCIQCEKKYVPINKGEMICFSCSFTRK